MQKAVKIFISYAHEDTEFVEQFVRHLSGLKRSGVIEEYYDRKISPGEIWDENIKSNLDNSDIIIFLLSADFLASEYIYDTEIKSALEKQSQGKVKIIPVLIRSCDFRSDPLSKFQFLPKNATAIQSPAWGNRDQAWSEVIDGLREIILGEKNLSANTGISYASDLAQKKRKGCTFQILISLCVLGLVATSAIYFFGGKFNGVESVPDVAKNISADSVKMDPNHETIGIDSAVVSIKIDTAKDFLHRNEVKSQETIAQIKKRNDEKMGGSEKDAHKVVIIPTNPTTAPTTRPPDKPTVTPPITAEKPKAPVITNEQLEMAFMDVADEKKDRQYFSPFLCGNDNIRVNLDNEVMSFYNFFEKLKEIKAKKIKKINVLTVRDENNCITSLKVSIQKKGLFN